MSDKKELFNKRISKIAELSQSMRALCLDSQFNALTDETNNRLGDLENQVCILLISFGL